MLCPVTRKMGVSLHVTWQAGVRQICVSNCGGLGSILCSRKYVTVCECLNS
jgi:hypothetical protein